MHTYVYVTNMPFKIQNISILLESSCMYMGGFFFFLFYKFLLVSNLISL